MNGDTLNRAGAVEAAKEYAAEDCLGQLGEVLEVQHEDQNWAVRFRTHTYADEHTHEVRINRVGNVFSHERENAAADE